MSESVTVVRCPTCRTKVRWVAASTWRPFCSERCKLIDLGQWAEEGYRLPAVETEPMENEI
ncbi:MULTISPECIES: DNA gyrase inhibitor YacG [unclassified Paludibacterium]|uniref:DNA gyrase inhibitor YacG n=1 Tax=unclassified Paludibacterium TaxID=2618429 RepID=UPI001C04641A|nr:DNA gyrase inhibitor YacG [Paludibacterium sp. B53371]BEV73349.1 hypothetical protein THUN1379_28310 [Paludibacterium sp. THUN1379]